jgi:hypothetical protein
VQLARLALRGESCLSELEEEGAHGRACAGQVSRRKQGFAQGAPRGLLERSKVPPAPGQRNGLWDASKPRLYRRGFADRVNEPRTKSLSFSIRPLSERYGAGRVEIRKEVSGIPAHRFGEVATGEGIEKAIAIRGHLRLQYEQLPRR